MSAIALNGGKIERWYKVDGDDVYRALNAQVDHIRTLSKPRLDRDKQFLRLYSPDVSGNGEDAIAFLKRDRPQFNMIKQGVDTMASQITPQRYLPQYVITEGEFSFQRIARLRTRVLEGQIYDLKLDEMMAAGFVEAAILGTSHLVGYLDPESGEPAIEKALPGEILIDPRSAVTGQIFEIYRDRALSRDAIGALYDVSDTDLSRASAPSDRSRDLLFLPRDKTLDEIQVREGWYWGPGKGRHVIALSSCVLVDEEWEWGNPTVPIRCMRRPVGYWGLGYAEIGRDSQARMDELLTRITDCQHLGTTAWVMVDRNAKVRTEKLGNAPLTMVQYTGGANPPTIQVFNAVPPELFAEVDRLRERFLSETGISQMTAEGKKPAGLNSAPALRENEDLTSKRHQPVADEYKRAWRGAIELLETLNARAQKQNGGYSVTARTQRGLVPLARTVKWSDVHLPPEKYRLTMLMTSDLPYQMAGRVQALEEYIASNMLTRPNAQRQVLAGPDDSMQRLELADSDYCFALVEDLLDGQDPVLDPHVNMQIAADIFRRVYLITRLQGAPEDVLAKLRALIDVAIHEAKTAQDEALAAEQAKAATVAAQTAQAAPATGALEAAGMPPGAPPPPV